MTRNSRVACHFRLAKMAPIGLLACIWVLGYLKCSAQSSTVSPGTTRCADCPLTAQKPRSQPFDEKRFQFITTPKAIVLPEGFFESMIIGRVLQTSPLIVEILDSDFRGFESKISTISGDVWRTRPMIMLSKKPSGKTIALGVVMN